MRDERIAKLSKNELKLYKIARRIGKPLTKEQIFANVRYAADNYLKAKVTYVNKLDKFFADRIYKACVDYYQVVVKSINSTNAKISLDIVKPKPEKFQNQNKYWFNRFKDWLKYKVVGRISGLFKRR
jgi:hypothetical protein